MRLSYPSIFRGGELDSEKNACGLNLAAMRFFLDLASGHHTFWDGETRVELSDTERQLLEYGTAVFSSLECSTMGLINIFSGQASVNLTVANTVSTAVNLNQIFIDSDYASFNATSRTLTIFQQGAYLITSVLRVEDPSSPNGPWRHLLQIRQAGATVFDLDERTYAANYETLKTAGIVNTLFDNQGIRMEYNQYSGTNVVLRAQNCRMDVLKIG